MTELPPGLADLVRLAALQAVKAYAPTRAEVEELRAALYANARLTPADVACLRLLLPAVAALAPDRWVTAAELLAAAPTAPGAAGADLRAALATIGDAPHPARRLGALLKRATGLPIDGRHFRRLDPPHRRDSALFTVAG